jgi:hypothetical protein
MNSQGLFSLHIHFNPKRPKLQFFSWFKSSHVRIQDEISSWDFAKVSSLAASLVHRFQRCGVLCKFVDDGARGSAGAAEMESKLEVRRCFFLIWRGELVENWSV